ncbi:MAG: TolC family protein [Proteobacteria bacterium]|nr:TolC family protein [Pseudomonadota bacterium]
MRQPLPERPLAIGMLLAALGCCSTAAQATNGEPQPLGLQRAIQYALAGNVQLKRERVRFVVAQANTYAARGLFDFVLSVNADYAQRRTPPAVRGGLNAGLRTSQDLSLSLTRPLETGGSVALTLEGGRVGSDVAFDCGRADQTKCAFYDSRWRLSFNHPLLRGLGVEVAMAEVRRSKLQEDLSLLNRHARAVVIVRDVVHHYWEMAYATRDLSIRRDALMLARQQLQRTRALIRAGRTAPSEVAAVELAIANRKRDVALAEQTLTLRGLALRRDFGLQAKPGISYVVSESATVQPYPPAVQELIQLALAFSPQLQSLRKGIELNDVDIRTALATTRPRLDFVASLGSTGRKPDMADSIGQMASLQQSTWSMGLRFELPLENRRASGAHWAALWNREGSQWEAEAFELELRESVVRTALELETAARRIELAEAAVRAAQQNLAAEQARFGAGQSTNNDVLQRQQELKEAELGVLRASIDWLISEASLDALSGRLLERLGLRLEGL